MKEHSHHKSFIQHENKSPMKERTFFKRTKQSRETESISLNQIHEHLITHFINLVKSDLSFGLSFALYQVQLYFLALEHTKCKQLYLTF